MLISILSCNKKRNIEKIIKVTKPTEIVGALTIKKSVDSLKETDFIGTIENPFIKNKNNIYSPTLAFCWNEIEKKLPNIKIETSTNNNDFSLLNKTKTYIHSLNKNEYKTEIVIKDDTIIAKSEYNLELTFNPFLEKFDYPITFKNVQVDGFGMSEWDDEKVKLLEIIYFEDNDNFIFKLKPSESTNELIFIKGLNSEKANSFKNIIEMYENRKAKGNKERKSKKNSWKYTLDYAETFSVPELCFDLEKEYQTIQGRTFMSENESYVIAQVKQRIALKLNNKGAKIISEASMMTACTDADAPVKIVKNLCLNNTFYILIKHINKVNPYFCAKIDNTELMTKSTIK